MLLRLGQGYALELVGDWLGIFGDRIGNGGGIESYRKHEVNFPEFRGHPRVVTLPSDGFSNAVAGAKQKFGSATD